MARPCAAGDRLGKVILAGREGGTVRRAGQADVWDAILIA